MLIAFNNSHTRTHRDRQPSPPLNHTYVDIVPVLICFVFVAYVKDSKKMKINEWKMQKSNRNCTCYKNFIKSRLIVCNKKINPHLHGWVFVCVRVSKREQVCVCLCVKNEFEGILICSCILIRPKYDY